MSDMIRQQMQEKLAEKQRLLDELKHLQQQMQELQAESEVRVAQVNKLEGGIETLLSLVGDDAARKALMQDIQNPKSERELSENDMPKTGHGSQESIEKVLKSVAGGKEG